MELESTGVYNGKAAAVHSDAACPIGRSRLAVLVGFIRLGRAEVEGHLRDALAQAFARRDSGDCGNGGAVTVCRI